VHKTAVIHVGQVMHFVEHQFFFEVKLIIFNTKLVFVTGKECRSSPFGEKMAISISIYQNPTRDQTDFNGSDLFCASFYFIF